MSYGKLGGTVVNRQFQSNFAPIEFTSGSFNLHVRGSRQLIVFVHGLGGRGYETWGELPKRMFEGAGGPPLDVGVFDYSSGHRRPFRGARFEFRAQQLGNALRDFGDDYDEIFAVGHSLGGLLVEEAARSWVQERALKSIWEPIPLAALVLIAVPRAGSGWAQRALQLVIPDVQVLRPLSAHCKEIDTFFSTYVERQNVVAASGGRTILPVYAVLGADDLMVNGFSAAFGIPEQQRLPLSGGHSSIVKPRAHDSELESWLHRLMRDRREVRAQAAREYRHSATRAAQTLGRPPAEVVTQFRTDPAGLHWAELYTEALQAATNTTVVVQDVRDVAITDVDLLIAVHATELVLAAAPAVRATVEGACAESATLRSMTVAISPVGAAFATAEETVQAWIAAAPASGDMYVNGAADSDALRDVLARGLQLVIGRRRHANAVGARVDAYGNTYHHQKGGGYP